ncbi:phosphoadenosine phosphosulfate reductase family protein [Bradyrhizobium sp. Leo121]|uniref:phosphoadenosine phosphosulfate reductase domain-containing protein n=1 Tax=Bradyrhizobium sp. Leo121 TaxID=1571195 RepID=UPI00102A653F|nr:phosphoadenosine phosphosulfate reductase family protein [Bradyrhizobium sp. Leo121]RZN30509.1 hypothetical protein CWO90_20445 [Bradyrhizobium sp. Leo121]
MSIIDEALNDLSKARSISAKALVAYSGGKDSLVVTDLAVRSFESVEGFFMYLVPGLECVERQLEEGRKWFGIKIRLYPHWIAAKYVREGVYCNDWHGNNDLPEWKLNDIYALAMQEAKIPFILTGAKRADSGWRRRFMTTNYKEAVRNPIAGWHKYDVLAYLRARHIPEPPSSGKSATGIDLSTPSLLWLHDTYPDDFKRLCEYFPFAEAVVWRRKFYGI